jgi:hypothetical protein
VAAKFNLKAQEVLNRVEGLEAMGRITGVLDDRGKFIFISTEEMGNVAKWIKLQVFECAVHACICLYVCIAYV